MTEESDLQLMVLKNLRQEDTKCILLQVPGLEYLGKSQPWACAIQEMHSWFLWKCLILLYYITQRQRGWSEAVTFLS